MAGRRRATWIGEGASPGDGLASGEGAPLPSVATLRSGDPGDGRPCGEGARDRRGRGAGAATREGKAPERRGAPHAATWIGEGAGRGDHAGAGRSGEGARPRA